MPYRELLGRLERVLSPDGSVVSLPDGSVDTYDRVFEGRRTPVDSRRRFADFLGDGRTGSARAERESRAAGSAATSVVDGEGIKVYFGLMLLGGAVAVAVRQVGESFGIPVLNAVSLVIVGATLLVGGTVVYSSLMAIRRANAGRAGTGVD